MADYDAAAVADYDAAAVAVRWRLCSGSSEWRHLGKWRNVSKFGGVVGGSWVGGRGNREYESNSTEVTVVEVTAASDKFELRRRPLRITGGRR